jgi:hypothetical protein
MLAPADTDKSKVTESVLTPGRATGCESVVDKPNDPMTTSPVVGNAELVAMAWMVEVSPEIVKDGFPIGCKVVDEVSDCATVAIFSPTQN